MTVEFFAYLLAGAAAGGFVNGLAGFGTSLFALGWWLQVMPPLHAVAVVLAMSVASGIQGLIRVRHAIEPARLARFLVPALLGIPIGLLILHRIDAFTLKMIVGGFLLTYGLYVLTRRNLPALERPTPLIDAGVGFSGGILGAIAGLSGALPTMWLSLRDWPRDKTRAVLQPFNVVVLTIAALLLAVQGAYDQKVLLTCLIALPATMIAAQAGLWLFGKLTDAQFRRLLVGLLTISGTVLLLREALG